MKFKITKWTEGKNEGTRLGTTNANTAYEALSKFGFTPDGTGELYETHTIRWVGTMFCRERADYISAIATEPVLY